MKNEMKPIATIIVSKNIPYILMVTVNGKQSLPYVKLPESKGYIPVSGLDIYSKVVNPADSNEFLGKWYLLEKSGLDKKVIKELKQFSKLVTKNCGSY